MRHARRLAHRVIEGQAFIVDPRAKVLHSLNPAGSRIWESAGRGASAEEIARMLVSEFDVGCERAAEDAAAFLRRLRSMDLLE